jgi:hypothetical protein
VSPDSPWFWIVVGVGSATFLAALRWIAVSVAASFREWVQEPVQKAQERAAVAADHAKTVADVIGKKNGHGDLMTMVATALTWQQQEAHSIADLARRVATLEAGQGALAQGVDLEENTAITKDIQHEVKSINGSTAPQLIEANEGRRIAADIPEKERTAGEQGYVDRLDKP